MEVSLRVWYEDGETIEFEVLILVFVEVSLRELLNTHKMSEELVLILVFVEVSLRANLSAVPTPIHFGLNPCFRGS